MLDFPLCEASAWEKLCGKRVVVYGTGNGADAVIDELERLGIEIIGVCASDSFVRDRSFRGFKVRRISEYDGDFVVAVAFASSLPQVMNSIYALANERTVIVPCVPVKGKELLNREFINKNFDRINRAYHLMADELSRKTFAAVVNFNFGGELPVLRSCEVPKNSVFGDVLRLGADESYLDIGAYRGDTVEEFFTQCSGEYLRITALEPDIKSYSKLLEATKGLHSFTALNAAAAQECGERMFSGAGGRQSSFADTGRPVRTVSIDSLSAQNPFSYIKIDSEGAESQALEGARVTLKEQKPKLNIAAYHCFEDIFRLPLMISELNGEYRIFLRHHPYIPAFDTNIYCI